MVRYYMNTFLVYLLSILLGIAAMVVLYRLLFNAAVLPAFEQVDSPTLAIGVSAIAVIAPVVAVTEALISWLKMWREARTKAELVKVIDAQSTAPHGMDIYALERASRLPRKILQERVNELILLGRIGVRITASETREYFLIGAG